MSTPLESKEHYIRRAALSMLLLSCAATAIATLLHRLQPRPHVLDLTIPPTLALSFGALFVYLWRRPQHLAQALWAGLLTALAGILVPIWWYVGAALQPGGPRLVDSLPPITAALIPITLAIAAFLSARTALITASVSWVLVALPILSFLLTHPDELLSPRGQEMVMTLGPVMLLVLVFIPFQHGMQQRMASLFAERAKMQALAERDVLTGLYNRRAGESFLRAVMGGNANIELAVFDIDRFKSINDTHGHAAGDLVLREIAARCSTRLRRDDIVARWGGEEFLVLIHTPADSATGQIAEGLRQVIAGTPILPVGKVTASFGVTRMHDGDTMATLLERADAALYAAKHGGRDRVVCR
jgi:diguanylate cyclase (GGDEF)-like protein